MAVEAPDEPSNGHGPARPSQRTKTTRAYYLIPEALVNVAKYAEATVARVAVSRIGDRAVVEVADDGIGGADLTRGSGLRGLADRIVALDGGLVVDSPRGAGTTIRATIAGLT